MAMVINTAMVALTVRPVKLRPSPTVSAGCPGDGLHCCRAHAHTDQHTPAN